MNRHPFVAVIRMQGVIAAGKGAGRLNDATLAPHIEAAFRKGKPKAVALVINSPGGSPVQSSLIAARIRRLAEETKLPVHGFVEDVAASGGYWLATAADDIYADESSILGSIGVISSGFGFNELIDRWGIERRVHTAGGSKSMLDPFQPQKPEDVERLHGILTPIHDAFKAQVTARRGDKLPEGRDLFTGEIWAGRGAIDVGLADGIGHVVPKLKEIYGDKLRFRIHKPRQPLFRRLGLSAEHAMSEFSDRAAYTRFGVEP